MRLIAASILCFILPACPLLLRAQTSTAAIQGMVINAQNGRVIPRANVLVRSAKDANRVKSVRADDSGRFSIEDLEPGAYRLTAQQQSFYSDSRRRTFQPIVELGPGEQRNDVLVRLLPSAVVTGQIIDEHSDPMEHVQVKLLSREYYKGRLLLRFAGIGVADDRGEYRIYDVNPGHYYLLAELNPELRKKGVEVIAAPGVTGVIDRSAAMRDSHDPEPEPSVSYPPQFYPGTMDFQQATLLPLNPGDEVKANFAFVSMPSVSIRGVVVNGVTGERVTNAAVAAYWTDILGAGGGNFAGTSKRDGTFEIRGIAPGQYTVRASFSDASGGCNGQETVEVGVHGADGVLVAGVPDFDIDGYVLVEGGEKAKAVKRVAVDFAPAKIAGAFRVAADGASLRFNARLRPGEQYTVNALNLPDDYYLKEVQAAGHSVERNQIVGAGPHERLDLILSPAGGHIEGLVWDDKDQPASVSVLLIPDAARRSYYDFFRSTHSDRKGKFTLRGIAPGSYTLIAFDGISADELINDPDLLKTYAERGETVIITESGRYSPLLHVLSVE